jgi:hypothetical protein
VACSVQRLCCWLGPQPLAVGCCKRDPTDQHHNTTFLFRQRPRVNYACQTLAAHWPHAPARYALFSLAALACAIGLVPKSKERDGLKGPHHFASVRNSSIPCAAFFAAILIGQPPKSMLVLSHTSHVPSQVVPNSTHLTVVSERLYHRWARVIAIGRHDVTCCRVNGFACLYRGRTHFPFNTLFRDSIGWLDKAVRGTHTALQEWCGARPKHTPPFITALLCAQHQLLRVYSRLHEGGVISHEHLLLSSVHQHGLHAVSGVNGCC